MLASSNISSDNSMSVSSTASGAPPMPTAESRKRKHSDKDEDNEECTMPPSKKPRLDELVDARASSELDPLIVQVVRAVDLMAAVLGWEEKRMGVGYRGLQLGLGLGVGEVLLNLLKEEEEQGEEGKEEEEG